MAKKRDKSIKIDCMYIDRRKGRKKGEGGGLGGGGEGESVH